jgi:hypothetical protein
MPRRQASCRQDGIASLRPVYWLVLLGVVAATVGAWLAVGAAREWPESSRSYSVPPRAA